MYKTHIMTQDSITMITGEGKPLCILKKDRDYPVVRNHILNRRFEDAISILDRVERVKKQSHIKLDVRNGIVYLFGKAIPKELGKRLRELVSAGISIQPLIKFWDNLRRNPTIRSREQLYNFLEVNNIPITENGCFTAYKYVTSEFKDFRTGRYNNTPGETVSMPRDSVDSNPNETCSHGLHVGAWAYVSRMGDNCKIVEVEVNPRHVVAVPVDYGGQKMRVCQYTVLGEINRTKEIPLERGVNTKRTYYYKYTKNRREFLEKQVTSHKPSRFILTCRANTTEEAIELLKDSWEKAV